MRHTLAIHICISILVLIDFSVANSQQLRKVGYKQLADDIFLSNKEIIEYTNVHFINDLPGKGDETFITSYLDRGAPETIYGGFKRYLETKGVKKERDGYYHTKFKRLLINECKFDNDLRFSNVLFSGEVVLENNQFPTQSEDFVGAYGQEFGGAVLIDSCNFKSSFVLYNRRNHSYRFFFKFNNSGTN